ncbi:Two component transcriptional regulator, winged helix family (plasmid) [Paraburkholderia caribensis MBA4]|uniref:Two component transcriptional regulator, winged helix family n=1 Tax=Paraburkholderia caribensis MBA4 TaxID=1323664 RepID=A0A0P0RRT2_9BURK|nr:response regulator [Paraburkholderia caribensis]ALL71787.1 Two component transcriptional regulator, winged helix family [Paraburkholderia caribensis MBA4]
MSRVLLVEDDANLRDALTAVLGSAGHDVTAARDGEEGVRLAPVANPEVIVSDVMMPVMEGPDMVRTIWTMPGFQRLPAILMSALVTEPPVPVAAMLHKPFDPVQLLDILDGLADSARTTAVPVSSVAARCHGHILRGAELVQAQEMRVRRLRELGIHTDSSEELLDRMKQSVAALKQFERTALATRHLFAPGATEHRTGIPLADRQA